MKNVYKVLFVFGLVVVGYFGFKKFVVKQNSVMEIAGSKMYIDKSFDNIVKSGDIVFSTPPAYLGNGNTSLRLDVYQPVGDTRTGRPALVLVHGGGFAGGSRGVFDDESKGGHFGWGRYFAERGYVVFSVDYRVGTEMLRLDDPKLVTIVNMATSDVLSGVRWIRNHASEYRIDPNKIAVGGNSAGAVVALYTAYHHGQVGNNTDNASADDSVSAAIALSGTIGQNDLGLIQAGSPPAIMFAGTVDTMVPYAWSLATKDRIKASGVRVDWYSYPGLGHDVAGHSDVAPIIANFLYEVMRLNEVATASVFVNTNTVKITPLPSVAKLVSVSPSPSPSPSLSPSQKASVAPSPSTAASVAPSVKPSAKPSVKPATKASIKPSPSPTPVASVEVTKFGPEEFVWHPGGMTVKPEIESNASELDNTSGNFLQKIGQVIWSMVSFVFNLN